MARIRADVRLVELGLASSRERAQALILAGKVYLNESRVEKAGQPIDSEARLSLKGSPLRYVSRGGIKLEGALNALSIDPSGWTVADFGASTGGFTDCLLQNGAKQVYGIDVGYGQVAWKIRQDPRVILRERTNLRHLTPEDLYKENVQRPDLGVMDVSFISLAKVLPAFWNLMAGTRECILLVKPQFEVGKERVGKKGVVRSSTDQAEAIFQVCFSANNLGWKYAGLTWSPIQGPAGNIEYLLWFNLESELLADRSAIAHITKLARQEFNHSSSLINNG